MDAPPIQYAKTEDDVSIAYWTVGDGPPLVIVPNCTLAHAALLWELPGSTRLLELMTRRWTVTYFDPRGSGLSEREITRFALEDMERDLAAVILAADLDRFALLGDFPSASLTAYYARYHEDRVSHLILLHPWAAWAELLEDAPVVSSLGMAGRDFPAYIEAITTLALGSDASVEERADFLRLTTAAVTTEEYGHYLEWFQKNDVADLLPEIETPTLVVHRRESAWNSVAVSRKVVERLPNAQLAVIEGQSNQLGFGDPLPLMAVLERFMGSAQTVATDASPVPTLRTILFTDVEDSTDLVVQHGDAKYRALLADHERLVREALAEHGGNEIKTIGDSFMCWFSSASAAIDAATSMQRKIMAHYGDDLRIRIGVHAGEPIVEDDDLWGTSVVRASRIMNKADGGQILVSQVVMDLVEGKGYLFSDAGEFALKGYEHAVHLFDVKWEAE